ncbi:restriction alleviation protein, Lar family [Slackia heliotrinireducens]|nr:Lar family restriction alleviation protein [Slackia heliotrinireducens]VEH01097.1 restriction alleviation protein, Lar family [Slackia heliotrinireducens]
MGGGTMTELKACPFCGKQTATVKHSRNWGYFVSCQCTAVGPGRATAQAAKDAWNKRTEPAQAVLPL